MLLMPLIKDEEQPIKILPEPSKWFCHVKPVRGRARNIEQAWYGQTFYVATVLFQHLAGRYLPGLIAQL